MALIKKMPKKKLVDELLHFQELATLVLPNREDFPKLSNIDYFAAVDPYEGCVGGDHLIIVNFEKYNLKEKIEQAREKGQANLLSKLEKNIDKFGILIADVAGHMITDATTGVYLDGLFNAAVPYELANNGEITPALFEMMNTRLYKYMRPEWLVSKPYTTMVYGEISNEGKFRFLSAGHPPPLIFSNEFDKLIRLDAGDSLSSTPLGVLPSEYAVDIERFEPTYKTKEKYSINEINLLGKGDILLLYTDGLMEQKNGQLDYSETRLEQVIRESKNESAKGLYSAIKEGLRNYSPVEDDLTLAVIKKRL